MARSKRPPAAPKPRHKPKAKSRPSAKGKASVARRSRGIAVTPLDNGGVETAEGGLRLNRFLASAGICSRRAADEMIAGGRVSLNGSVVLELGTRVDPANDDVQVDGRRVRTERLIHVLFNKPKGVLCTNARQEQRKRVVDCLPAELGRLFTVGRLDAESEGLILVTNDGRFAQRVAHPRHGVPKTYAVLVKGRVTPEDLQRAKGGVWLSDGRTATSRIAIERRGRDKTYLKVTLREGRNREIRRVFAKLGYPVISLKRIRIGDLTLHGLGAGKYRVLGRHEVAGLLALAESE
jgi:23S rRNA pseudouridine2605 synthase